MQGPSQTAVLVAVQFLVSSPCCAHRHTEEQQNGSVGVSVGVVLHVFPVRKPSPLFSSSTTFSTTDYKKDGELEES